MGDGHDRVHSHSHPGIMNRYNRFGAGGNQVFPGGFRQNLTYLAVCRLKTGFAPLKTKAFTVETKVKAGKMTSITGLDIQQ